MAGGASTSYVFTDFDRVSLVSRERGRVWMMGACGGVGGCQTCLATSLLYFWDV